MSIKTNEKLMILGVGIIQLPAILKVKEIGLITIVCSYNDYNPGMK